MKKILFIPLLVLPSLSFAIPEMSAHHEVAETGYRECVAASLFTMEGKELNSIIENHRTIPDTNRIPEGWTVVGITTERVGAVSKPYMLICH